MASCSLSSEQKSHMIISTTSSTQHINGESTKKNNQSTAIKFSIDEILKPSFGRCQMKENNPKTSLTLYEKANINLISDSKPNSFCHTCEENVREMSLYENSDKKVADNDIDGCHISDCEVIHERSIQQPIDISYLLNFHLANYQLGGALDKQREFYLPYGFHIGTQLHFMDPFGHFLHGFYARCYGNYDNYELGDIRNSCSFEEKTHLENTTINPARTCQDDIKLSNKNMFRNICTTEIMHDQLKKCDYKHNRRIALTDTLPNSSKRVITTDLKTPSEFKTPTCSSKLPAEWPSKKQNIIHHESSNIKQSAPDNNIHNNSGVNHHVAACAQSDKGERSALNGNDLKELPAWVFCTRYSDRPSSGPRYRKARQKTKSEIDKRPRTAFTSQQLQCLRSEFDSCPYLCEQRRQQLSVTLSLSESQVKIWFQNKRAKLKKRSGRKNSLAMKLMEEGLYNHSTIIADDDSNQDIQMDNAIR